MFTSTPISNRRKASAFKFFENSPISRSNADLIAVPKQLMKYQNKKKREITVFKVLGKEKTPLFKMKKGSSLQKSTSSHPPMVVISDSEEEEETHDIYSEVTLPRNSNSSIRRKSVKMDVDQQKENVKRIKSSNAITLLKENLSETENKNIQKRISRVDSIIDEIIKERKPTVFNPSPLFKVKNEYSADAIVEEGKNDLEIRRVTRSSTLSSKDLRNQRGNDRRFSYHPNILGGVPQTKPAEVTGKLQDIGNLDKINIRRTRKRAKSTIKKEEHIQDDDELKVLEKIPLTLLNCIDSNKKEIIKKVSNCENFEFNYKNNQSNTISKICSRGELFNENLPVFYNQEEVTDNNWIQVNGQNGVFVKKNFRMLNISNGFVKIEAKCSLQLHSVRSQIFNVAEGRGIFVYDNNIKVKIGPGQTVTIPAGFPCQIINSGLKKNLVFSFVKIYSE